MVLDPGVFANLEQIFSSAPGDSHSGPPLVNAFTALKVMTGAAAGAAAFANPIAGAVLGGVSLVCDSALNGIDAHDTQSTVAQLRRIREKDIPKLWNSKNWWADPLTRVVDNALAKKRRHVAIAWAQASQVGRIATVPYRSGKSVYKQIKGTKGASRALDADNLIAAMNSGDPMAVPVASKIVAAIAQRKFKESLQSSFRNSLMEALRS